MRIAAAVLLVLLLAAPAVSGEDVSFTTKDGLRIAGALYASGRKGAAGVVALPMYRHDRSTYAAIAERFNGQGIDFVAIDPRGHGDSAVQGEEDLSQRVNSRDPKLFNAMWQDALAAREFLISKGTDPNRIGLLGASVGCSVAIDAAGREPMIAGVCAMTPGKNYLGVDTMADLEAYGKRPMLILSSKEEAGVGATAIEEKAPGAELVLFEQKNVHGTKMFGKVPEVESRIVGWFRKLLAEGVALDGELQKRERARHEVWAMEGGEGKKCHFFAEPRGRWWYVVAYPSPGTDLPDGLELELALRSGERGWSIRWDADGGTWTRKMLRDGKWAPYRVKAAPGPGPAAARDRVVEILVPMRRGFEPSPELRIRVAAKVGDAEASSGWKPLAK